MSGARISIAEYAVRDAQRADVEVGQTGRLRELSPRPACVLMMREEHEELRDAERGDDAHEPRCVAQPPDHDDLGGRAGESRHDEREREREPVRHVPRAPRPRRRRRAEGADLAVGEVDDPVRAVDEHEADGEQAVGHADDRAEGDRTAP